MKRQALSLPQTYLRQRRRLLYVVAAEEHEAPRCFVTFFLRIAEAILPVIRDFVRPFQQRKQNNAIIAYRHSNPWYIYAGRDRRFSTPPTLDTIESRYAGDAADSTPHAPPRLFVLSPSRRPSQPTAATPSISLSPASPARSLSSGKYASASKVAEYRHSPI